MASGRELENAPFLADHCGWASPQPRSGGGARMRPLERLGDRSFLLVHSSSGAYSRRDTPARTGVGKPAAAGISRGLCEYRPNRERCTQGDTGNTAIADKRTRIISYARNLHIPRIHL